MASLCLFVLQLSSLFAWRNVRTRTRKKYNLMQEADEANADGDHLARQERQPVACRPRDHVWLLWMIILGCDKVCWDVCPDGHNLTCAWRGWYSKGSSSLRSCVVDRWWQHLGRLLILWNGVEQNQRCVQLGVEDDQPTSSKVKIFEDRKLLNLTKQVIENYSRVTAAANA